MDAVLAVRVAGIVCEVVIVRGVKVDAIAVVRAYVVGKRTVGGVEIDAVVVVVGAVVV